VFAERCFYLLSGTFTALCVLRLTLHISAFWKHSEFMDFAELSK
jgi:hypothetical protein